MNNSKSKSIIISCLILFACVGAFISSYYIYLNLTWDKEIHNVSYGDSENFGTNEDPTWVPKIQVNLMENPGSAGMELAEIRFNSWTDESKTMQRIQGYQKVGTKYRNLPTSNYIVINTTTLTQEKQYAAAIHKPYPGKTLVNGGILFFKDAEAPKLPTDKDDSYFTMANQSIDSLMDNAFYWYEGDYNTTEDGPDQWRLGNVMTRNTEQGTLYWEFGEEIFAVRLNNYSTVLRETGLFRENRNLDVYFETYGTLFNHIMDSVRSNNRGYGDWEFGFDLSKFFSLYRYEGNGKFNENPIGPEEAVNFLYIKVGVHYEKNNAVLARQSLFGIVAENPSWNPTGITDGTDFGTYGTRYKVTESDFELRYSAAHGGNLVSLKDDIALYLKEKNLIMVDVEINTSSDNNIKGLDYSAFYDIPINGTFTVTGSGNFYLLDYSLYNTGLTEIQHSAGITLVQSANATDGNLTEVII